MTVDDSISLHLLRSEAFEIKLFMLFINLSLIRLFHRIDQRQKDLFSYRIIWPIYGRLMMRINTTDGCGIHNPHSFLSMKPRFKRRRSLCYKFHCLHIPLKNRQLSDWRKINKDIKCSTAEWRNICTFFLFSDQERLTYTIMYKVKSQNLPPLLFIHMLLYFNDVHSFWGWKQGRNVDRVDAFIASTVPEKKRLTWNLTKR